MSRLTNEDIVFLHCHTHDSNNRIKDSICKTSELIKYANKLGNKGVAITDHECISAHVTAVNAIKELKDNGDLNEDFKLILGNEIYLVDEVEMKNSLESKDKVKFYHCILLAKDPIGHHQLRLLSSRAWRDNYFSYRGMDRRPTYYSDIEEVIGDDKGHLICSTACLGSYLGTLSNELMQTEDEDEQYNIKTRMVDFIDWGTDIFGDDFYLEMQPNKSEEQIYYNQLLSRMSLAYDIPMIITTDIHYYDESFKGVHKAFLTSDENDSNREVDDFYDSTRFFEVDEIYEYMDYLDEDVITEAIRNTKKIADMITDGYELFHSTKIPLTPLPPKNEWYPVNMSIIENYPSMLALYEDEYEHHTYLIHQIFKGINDKKIPFKDMKETLERVDLECSELVGLTEYFHEPTGAYLTTMQKNIDLIWNVSVIGCSRGSALGWIINYLLGITQINPLKQKGMTLQHWRFLSKERPDWADIDIDYSSHLKNTVFEEVKKYYESIGGTVVRVATFRTETSKSAILTACRGLHINNDIAQYISSLVKIERGFVWSISDMYYGDPKSGREPVTEFINIVDEYKDKNLLETMLAIEGLKSGCSSHASGVLMLNEPLEEKSSYMRTPSGELITAYDLHEEESLGHIKFDFLLTNSISLLQLTIEMLCRDGYMEWQGSLRATYDKYLLPEVINMEDERIWDLICQGKLMNIFQFETQVGSVAIQKLQPKSLLDLANANSLMRLMNPDSEQPIDKYIRFRDNPQLWEQEMIDYGLNEEDRQVMHELLDNQCGVCSNQESMMELFMHPKVVNYGIKQVNAIRKGVAKKKKSVLDQAERELYHTQEELGTSKKLVDYCWDVQTGYSKGYSFSLLHTCGYSTIAVQEAWLFLNYPSIYWYCANLMSMAGTLEQEDVQDDFFEAKEQTTNYGKVAKAISRVQSEGVTVDLPNINNSELGFIPKAEDETILFGLKGITSINNDTVKTIIDNRPYTSLQDFHKRLVEVKEEKVLSTGKTQMKSLVSTGQTITLIKAGAFDKLENKPREEILEGYLRLLNPDRQSLTTASLNKIVEMGLVPEDKKIFVRYYNFRDFLNTLPKENDEKSKKMKWITIDCGDNDTTEYTMNFLDEHFMAEMEEEKGYRYNDEGQLQILLGTSRKGSFEKAYENKMEEFKQWLNSDDCLGLYNRQCFEAVKKDNMVGSISKWEMDSLCFYYHEHELAHMDFDKYDVVDFNTLPEEPVIVGYNKGQGGVQYPKYELTRIAGTILDRDKNKHFITVLTPTGVVTVKFYSGQFSFYDKTISIYDEQQDKKITLENSWFKRGNKVLITGFRRGDKFFPKKYQNSIFRHTIQLIKSIDERGNLELQSDRVTIDEE